MTETDRRTTDDRVATSADAPVDLAVFVERHYERLMSLARLITRDATDAADAVQIGLEAAWRQRASLRDPDRLRPWLDRIVVREAVRVPAVAAVQTAGCG